MLTLKQPFGLVNQFNQNMIGVVKMLHTRKGKAILGTVLTIALLATGLTGCANTKEPSNTQDNSSQVEDNTNTSKPTNTTEPSDKSEPTDTLEEQNIFKGTAYERAFKMLGMLDNDSKNVMISPLSIETALSMAVNGMDDKARSLMEGYLGNNKDLLNELNKEYLDSKLSNSDEDNVISIANSLWVKDTFKDNINDEFKQTLKNNYTADIETFNNSPEPINSWVSDKTNGMIPTIIDEIPENLSSILLNAVYFNGVWQEPFNTEQLEDGKFIGKDRTEADCTYMNDNIFSYMENSQATAFRKNYDGGYSFIGILPKAETNFDISTFNMATLLETETHEYEVLVKIPKFESEYGTSLKNTLTDLGLGDIFRTNSMSKVLDIPDPTGISDIVHKTAIKMNEEGTEASAVTGIMMETMGVTVQKEQKQVYLDKPFIYAIMDDSSNQILFLGTINNLK